MRLIFKIPLFAAIGFIFSVIVVICLYYFTSLPETQINRLLGSRFITDSGLRIKIGKINRDLWSRLEAEEVSIAISNNKFTQDICHIRRIEVRYSLKDIIAGRLYLQKLEADSIELRVDDEYYAGLTGGADGKKKSKPKLPKIKIDDLFINDASIDVKFGGVESNVNLALFRGMLDSDGGKVIAKIDTLAAEDVGRQLKLESVKGGIKYTGSEISFDALNLISSQSNISLTGAVSLADRFPFDLRYSVEPLEFEDINKLAPIKLDGNARLSGVAKGNIDSFSGTAAGDLQLYDQKIKNIDCQLLVEGKRIRFDRIAATVFESPARGKGVIDFGSKPQRYEFTGDVSDLNLRNIGIDIYSRFNGAIILKGSGLSANTLKMAIDMRLNRADIDIYHFHEAAGSIEFDFNRLTFKPGFKARYKDARFEFGGWLEYAGDVDISGKAEFGNLADFQNQFFIADLDGRGQSQFKVSGPLEDFSFAGSFVSDSCRFYGLFSRDFSVDIGLDNFITHMKGRVNGEFEKALLYSIPVDSGEFSIGVDGQIFGIDKAYLGNENNRMTFTGVVDNTTYPARLTVDTVTLVLWDDTVTNKGKLHLSIDTLKAEFLDFKLAYGSGFLDMKGVLGFDNSMDLAIDFSGFKIAPLIKYFHYPHRLDGVLSGKLVAGGIFESPIFDANLTMKEFRIDNIPQGDFFLTASYADKRCALKSARLEDSESRYELSGIFPLELSFDYSGDRLLDLPIEAKFKAEGSSISLVPAFVPSVERCRGKFKADFTAGGTYLKPNVAGRFYFEQGMIKALDLVNPIENVRISGTMENDLIHVDSIFATLVLRRRGDDRNKGASNGSRGAISGKGNIKIVGIGLFDYDIRLTGKGCEFFTESYDIQGTTDFDLQIIGSSPPVISGTATLSRLDMREGFATFSKGITPETEILEDSTQWTVEVEINALNNLWIKNSEADMEMMGNVLFFRQAGIPHLLGQLNILRGDFYLFNYEFKIEKGEMTFNDISVINPQINFEVKTKLRNTRQYDRMAAGTGGYDDLVLIIGGTLLEPEIRALSGSEYSDEDILRMLLADQVSLFSRTGTTDVGLADNILNKASFVLTRLSNQIERTKVIDELEINPYADSLGQTRISVAKYLSPRLFLRYSRSLSSESGETIGLEYLFNRYLSFQGRQGSKYEGISFDLIFNYEF